MENFYPLDSLGFAMAYGYYLNLKRTSLSDRFREIIDTFEANNNISFSDRGREFYLLVPMLSNCDITKFEQDLTYFADAIPIENDICGTKDRPYRLPVYKHEDEYFFIDMASCLDCTLRIRLNGRSLNTKKQEAIRCQFVNVLSYLVYEDIAYRNFCKILTYNDNDKFSDVLKQSVDSTRFQKQPEIPLLHLGAGLAYWFYYNYIINLIPELLETMRLWQNNEKVSLRAEKLYILVPHSCYCPNSIMGRRDLKISYAKNLENKPTTQIGADKNRRYPKSVLAIEYPEERYTYCLAEFATPIRQLYKMYYEHSHTFNHNEVKIETVRQQFVSQLNELLENQEKTFEVIEYDDSANTVLLSELLLKQMD